MLSSLGFLFFRLHKCSSLSLSLYVICSSIPMTYSLDPLQYINAFLVLGSPKLNTVFQVQSHKCQIEGNNHFPSTCSLCPRYYSLVCSWPSLLRGYTTFTCSACLQGHTDHFLQSFKSPDCTVIV